MKVPVVALQGKDGVRLEPVRKIADEWCSEPERRAGTARAFTLASFIASPLTRSMIVRP
jgi:hypothetical protein